MKKKYPDRIPIWYKESDLEKQPHELIEDLRRDVAIIRGKLYDIKSTYGWEDRIEHLEGGLTCLIAAMYQVQSEFEEFESKVSKT